MFPETVVELIPKTKTGINGILHGTHKGKRWFSHPANEYQKQDSVITESKVPIIGTENASDTVWYVLREFADVLTLQEAKQKLHEEIDYAKNLLNDETKVRGKDDFLSIITAIEQILEVTTNPSDVSFILKAIEDLKEAGESYATINQMIDSQEWMVLLTYYQSVGEGEGWKNKWDFSSNVPSVATLPGVTAYNGHVTEINLAGNGLSGSFPIMLLALPMLESMNLSSNQLTGNLGMTLATYIKKNPTVNIVVKDLDISNNQFVGNIGLFANCFPSLVSLNASGNCFEDVFPVIPVTVTTLNLSNQTISRVVPLHLSHLSVNDIATKVPTILLYNHQMQTFIPNINLLCSTQYDNWRMTMSYQNGIFSIPYISEQNTYYGESGDTLNVAVLNNNGTPDGTTFRISLSFDEGDGNFDGKVNVLDLQTTLNFMFEEYSNKPYNFTASNLWKDDVINVQDAVSLVNILIDYNPASAAVRANYQGGRRNTMNSDDATAYVADGNLIVKTSAPVSSFDIIIATGSEYNVNEELVSAGFICKVKYFNNEIHLIGYSLCGATLPVGENVLGSLNEGYVTYSMLADAEAREITTAFGVTPTGISSAISDVQKSDEVYRISLGAKRYIVIDANGKKYMVTEK